MSSPRPFESLPGDWALRPMTDADLFIGVVDLAIREEARAIGSVGALLCHPDGRLMQLVVPDVTPLGALDELEEQLNVFVRVLGQTGVPALVLVLGRPGESAPTSHDEQVCEIFTRVCAAHGPVLLGMALATPDGVRAMTRGESTEAA